MGKVSVIIPTYNRENTIERAIQSVREQTYQDIEIIVVDDGSTDNTEKVVTSIEDSRIRYVKMNRNSGAAAARNRGVQCAMGAFVAFLDSDDMWRPDKLEKQMDYWGRHEDAAMVYCAYCMHCKAGHGKVPGDNWGRELEGDIFSSLLIRNSVGTPTIVVRKECFIACGGFNENCGCIEDWEFVVRFAEKYRIAYLDEILVDAYESHGGVSSNTGAFFEVRCKMIAKYKNQLLQDGTFDDVVQELFQRAEYRGLLEPVKRMLMTLLQ